MISLVIRQFILLKYNLIYYKATIVKLTPHCFFSGRTLAVNKSLGLARFNTRRLINAGLVNGFRRSS
jgi:ribosomal protein S14